MLLCEYNKSFICDFDFGKNPIKQNSSLFLGIWEINVTAALAPGSAVTLLPAFFNSSTRIAPGSQNNGVPASDTNAIFFPSSINRRNCATRSRSLNLWYEMHFVGIEKWLSNFWVLRLSSHAITSTAFSTSIALAVISPKFPIGVGTI